MRIKQRKRVLLLPSALVSAVEAVVDRNAKAVLLSFRQQSLSLAVFAKSPGDHFEEHYACMRN